MFLLRDGNPASEEAVETEENPEILTQLNRLG